MTDLSTDTPRVRVCFVCLGNICRSPQAEGIFLHLVAAAGLQAHVHVDSAGTGAWHVGELADPRTRATSARHGIELRSRARQFVVGDFERFDYILAMDRSNFENLRRLARHDDDRARVHLLRSFDPLSDDLSVPDPYAGGPDGFEHVFLMCQAACAHLLRHIRERHGLGHQPR